MSLRLMQAQSLTLNTALENHWNKKLSGKRALAPRQLQNSITDEDYSSYNLSFDDFCSDYIRLELENMYSELGGDYLYECNVSVLGPGLGRGLRFIPYANQIGMRVGLYDLSKTAIDLADQALKSMNVYNHNFTEQVELTGEDGQVSSDTMLFVVSQFLQILSPETMNKIMQMIARQMDKVRTCRCIIVHPFDNSDDPGWGDTNPYTMNQLLSPMQEIVGWMPKIIREESFLYFGKHNYKAFTIMP